MAASLVLNTSEDYAPLLITIAHAARIPYLSPKKQWLRLSLGFLIAGGCLIICANAHYPRQLPRLSSALRIAGQDSRAVFAQDCGQSLARQIVDVSRGASGQRERLAGSFFMRIGDLLAISAQSGEFPDCRAIAAAVTMSPPSRPIFADDSFL